MARPLVAKERVKLGQDSTSEALRKSPLAEAQLKKPLSPCGLQADQRGAKEAGHSLRAWGSRLLRQDLAPKWH
ncbi:hypothetical protein NDU88_001299 [Pleurodeles waltl]|uniref:Uncharacterized protein n=1 Tax=Pleurodeles waltl TaxID=8319 RepID=A0AAV7KSH3_PLEWA|nr:hypothetical protein NDU88_001299 [Pleurodeles waltl]